MASSATKPGTIDLVGLFESVANQLALAIVQGRLLHKTKNIREAGAPFEVEFRTFLHNRLAAPFRVANGYLFDPASICTPQIDAIVVDERGALEMLRTPEGASYVPYPCGRVLFEIKSSSKGITKHIAQITAIGDALNRMGQRAARFTPNSDRAQAAPLSVLIIGDSSGAKISAFQKLYTKSLTHPHVTWLADRGLIIARRGNDLSDFIYFTAESGEKAPIGLDFDLRTAGGEWAIWRPTKAEPRRGISLLWLYFAMVTTLNLAATGSRGFVREFTDQIERDYPMILQEELRHAKGWKLKPVK